MAGASVRVELASDWRAQLSAAEIPFLDHTMGEPILADMQAGTPVDTGRLRAAERKEVIDGPDGTPELHVGVYPDDDGPVPYKLAVEFGFHGMETVTAHWNRNFMGTGETVWIREHERMGNSPEQPYMRPALWRVRTP